MAGRLLIDAGGIADYDKQRWTNPYPNVRLPNPAIPLFPVPPPNVWRWFGL
jgi:hypothetical protein